MISSNSVLMPVLDVGVAREARHRESLNQSKILELADSIARNGLIHTILVDIDDQLIAGEHRLMAFKHLYSNNTPCPFPDYDNWQLIPARIAHNVTEAELAALELEENIKRSDMTWQDEARAIQKYHALRAGADTSWNAAKTAAALGLSPSTTSRYMAVATELEAGNRKIIAASGPDSAYNILSRSRDRAIESELEALVQHADPGEALCRAEILHSNFLAWAPNYTGPRFNFIHCDFPYGIAWDKAGVASLGASSEWRDTENLYEDSPDTYFALLDMLLATRDRVMSQSCHIMFWLSMKFHRHTVEAFRDHGFWVWHSPLVWHKSDNRGVCARPDFEPLRNYEVALMISRGDRKIVSPTVACYAGPTIKEIHTSEKPEPMLRYFFRMFVDEHSQVLDPTCGSGTSIRAAESLGAKRALGLELSEDYATKAREALHRAVRLRAMANS